MAAEPYTLTCKGCRRTVTLRRTGGPPRRVWCSPTCKERARRHASEPCTWCGSLRHADALVDGVCARPKHQGETSCAEQKHRAVAMLEALGNRQFRVGPDRRLIFTP